MELITEEEYRNFIEQRTKINELILAKTIELSMIIFNEPPKGECYDYKFEENDGKILVQFERYVCQETDYDTFQLPIEFLFDETYPEKYKKIHEEEVKKKEEEKLRLKKEREENQKKFLKNMKEKSMKDLKRSLRKIIVS